jgi:transposase
MKIRKKYSKEFKLDAVSLVVEQGYSNIDAAKSLGIGSSMLSRWTKEYQNDDDGQVFRGNGKLTPELEEIRQLKAQVKCLIMEKDILKKATVFFAKEMR